MLWLDCFECQVIHNSVIIRCAESKKTIKNVVLLHPFLTLKLLRNFLGSKLYWFLFHNIKGQDLCKVFGWLPCLTLLDSVIMFACVRALFCVRWEDRCQEILKQWGTFIKILSSKCSKQNSQKAVTALRQI